MSDNEMTREKRDFATKWHNLIYTFLNEKRLPESDYYDIVVFGFLRAVKQYFSKPALQKYSFSTIAWKLMLQSVSAYYRDQNRQKRCGYTISLNSLGYEDTPFFHAEALTSPDTLMLQLEESLLLHELAAKATRQQMAIVQLRSAGYNMREIAKTQSISMKQVQELFSEIRDLLAVVCHG